MITYLCTDRQEGTLREMHSELYTVIRVLKLETHTPPGFQLMCCHRAAARAFGDSQSRSLFLSQVPSSCCCGLLEAAVAWLKLCPCRQPVEKLWLEGHESITLDLRMVSKVPILTYNRVTFLCFAREW